MALNHPELANLQINSLAGLVPVPGPVLASHGTLRESPGDGGKRHLGARSSRQWPLQLNNLAQLLAALGQFEPAIAHSRRALMPFPSRPSVKDHPTTATRLSNLGLLLETAEQFPEAIEKLAPGSSSHRAQLWARCILMVPSG